MTFQVDPRIEQSSHYLFNSRLSRVYLKNDARFPWLILVPCREGVSELHELNPTDRDCLMNEINAVSVLMKTHFKPDKLNIGALGNIVSQCHVHVVARYRHDALWPHGVWQDSGESEAYSEEALETLRSKLSINILSF
jgi:diadenosine tetraphosphate (Ap4A) HIT family hydrolase